MTPIVRTSSKVDIVKKLWHFCNVLRDDGLSYPDYVEQLTYLLFIKMADEHGDDALPAKFRWKQLVSLPPVELAAAYSETLSVLGSGNGIFGLIFSDSRNKIADSYKLWILVKDLIGTTTWSTLSDDVKGEAYEGLLEKNARDTKSGAGQYFTPRPLIDAIVACIKPEPNDLVCDPACGTGGFLLSASKYVRAAFGKRVRCLGIELVKDVARLAAMNLFLHDVRGPANDKLPIRCEDSLKATFKRKCSVIMTNPPFGTKGNVKQFSDGTSDGKVGQALRPDFWALTGNKQLNFLQHIASMLGPRGRAAVIVPDNVLFEGGAASVIRRQILTRFKLHTVLRLPTGIFYAQGVKASVLFFDRLLNESSSDILFYDLRTSLQVTRKANPLKASDLVEFVRLYNLRQEGTYRQNTSDGSAWVVDASEVLSTKEGSLDISAPLVPHDKSERATLSQLALRIANDLETALRLIREVE